MDIVEERKNGAKNFKKRCVKSLEKSMIMICC